jgi:hypothetical protein
MKLGFICLNAPGHLNPMTALARQLQGRNHEVVWTGNTMNYLVTTASWRRLILQPNFANSSVRIKTRTRFPLLLHKLAETRQDKFAILFDLFVGDHAKKSLNWWLPGSQMESRELFALLQKWRLRNSILSLTERASSVCGGSNAKLCTLLPYL